MIARRQMLATFSAALCFAGLRVQAQHADLPIEEATAAGPRRFMMEDLYGNVVTDENLQGQFSLIYFGYTGCPDVCPTTLSTIADVMVELGDDANRLVPYFVTVDPDRDTASLLRDYLGFFDKRIEGLRGPKPYTDHMVKTYNARYEFHVPDPAEPDDYSVDHTASMAFVGPDGQIIKRFAHGLSAESITADIRAALAEVPAQ